MPKYQIKKKPKPEDHLEYIQEPKTIEDYLTNCIIEARTYKNRLNILMRRVGVMKRPQVIKDNVMAHAKRTQWHIRNLLGFLYEIIKLRIKEQEVEK